jgi:serine/threonine protein phosphatase PrpC
LTTLLEVAYTMHRGTPPAQQDALLVAGQVFQARSLTPKSATLEGDALFAIADGVAVSPGAGRASRTVVEALPGVLADYPDAGTDGMLGTRHVRLVQQRLCSELTQGAVRYGASSTLVAVHLRGNHAAIVNVGDSRAYLVRGAHVTQLSRDHTQLQAMRDAGELDERIEYASIYNALSDCLVADPEADVFDVHRTTLSLEPGDLFVLCSDGIHDTLGEPAWCELLAHHAVPAQLVQAARRAVLERHAPDNFTLFAVRFAGWG